MNIIEQLKQKDNKQAYQLLLTLEKTSACSNELYFYFDDFLLLLQSDNSCVRARGLE